MKRTSKGSAILAALIAVIGIFASTAAQAQIVSGAIYNLICKTSGLALDNEGSTAVGNDVWQWTPIAGNTNQQWQINILGNGMYNLICMTSDMALDNGGSTSNGAPATQYTAESGNTNQEWTITSVGGGYYQLVCASSGDALDNSGSTSNGGTVWQWVPISGNTNQMWQIVPAPSAPFGGTPAPIPGTVQAENYDTGGQGIGYSVTSVNGSANSYRSDGVDLEATTDTGGGYDVGWSAAGQWFHYTVNVSTAGKYTVTFRVANGTTSNGTFQLDNSSGTDLSGVVTVAPTGGWQTWTNATATVTLPAGQQVLTWYQDAGGFNLNYMTFTSTGASCSASPSAPTGLAASNTTSTGTTLNWSTVTPPANCSVSGYTVYLGSTALATTTGTSYNVTGLSASTTYSFTVTAADSNGTGSHSTALSVTTSATTSTEGPFGGTPAAIPGVVQAENYDTGGQGVGYSVSSVNGSANDYRSDGVDLEETSDVGGGYDLGWTAAGQWFRYTINVQSAQTYPVTFRVSNGTTGNGSFHLQNAAGTNLTGEITVPPTGGWQTFITVAASITLPAGQQVLTLSQDSGGFNVNLFTVASLTPTSFPAVVIPQYGIDQVIVAATTPQAYGAVANGTTDCTSAFQNAINAVYNSREGGGGVVYVPAGKYLLNGNLTIPTGVTLQGDWVDWTTSNAGGAVGTTLMVTSGAGNGAASAAAFITLGASATVRDINIWYPNQNPNSITPYPFTIGIGGDDCVIHDVALVNAYQGVCDIPAQPAGGTKFVLSTVVGTPLFMGAEFNEIADVSHADDVRFTPNAWAVSGLSGAPAAGSAYASWMLANGTGLSMGRMDGLVDVNNTISGYNVGVNLFQDSSGNTGATFYQTNITGCNTGLFVQSDAPASGVEFTECTIDDAVAINKSGTAYDAILTFEDCGITGTNGTAVTSTGADSSNTMAFDNCTFNGTLNLTTGVFNVTNSSLTGNPQCTMSSSATRAAFTGCTFSPSQNIVNNGNSQNLIVNSNAPQSEISSLPTTTWSSIVNNRLSRQPAKTTLFQAINYGATGNGSTDDTTDIQNALNAAGSNGGGIVYLAPGLYKTSNSLTVPSGVELRGTYTMRHGTWAGANGVQQGSVIQPVGGQGGTSGPPAVVLGANAGVVGVTIHYPTQFGPNQSSILAFPPAIQGRGANDYVIGVQSDNPYIYIDFDTYTCTNHLIYMADGWAINTGFHVGNGSSGVIADCHANWTYWIDNYTSPSNVGSSVNGTPLLNYTAANSTYFTFGNCTETYWGNFSIIQNTFVHLTSENGAGPNVTMIDPYCDATIQGFLCDSTAATNIDIANADICLVNTGSASPNLETLTSTSGFAGTVRMFNMAEFGSPSPNDLVIGGGDVGLQLFHFWPYGANGTYVYGGVVHLVNGGMLQPTNAPYDLTFGPNAGISGKTSETIGLYSFDGFNLSAPPTPLNYWDDYALSSYTNL